MFFDINLLCPQHKGKFAIIWIAATRGVNKLSKKQILDVDIVEVCKNITAMYVTQSQKPKARLSLSLTARLVNGTIKIFRFQTVILQEELTFCLVIPRAIRKPDGKVATKKKTRKVYSEDIISSEEMVTPAKKVQPPEKPLELEITDQDVERALRGVPQALVDSITLREEVPKRTVTLDIDEQGFGELGFLETLPPLERAPPISDIGGTDIRDRKTSEESPEEPQVETIQVVAVIEPPPRERMELEKALTPPEEEVPRRRTRREAAQENLEAIQTIEEIEEPPSKRSRVEEAVEQPKQPKILKKVQDVDVERQKGERRDIIPRNKMYLVEINPNKTFKRTRYRCAQDYEEIFRKVDYDLSKIMADRFEDMYEQLTPILRKDNHIESVLRRGSQSSRTASVSGLLRRVSQETPTASILAHEYTADVSEEALRKKLSDERISITRAKRAALQKRIPSPEVEVPTVRMEPGTLAETPASQEIERRTLETVVEDEGIPVPATIEEMRTTDLALQTIIEEMPLAGFTQKEPPAIVTLPTPVTWAEKRTKEVEARQRKIARIARDWDYTVRDLTIEDICEKPLNRFNLAVAFSDLLNLHKLQYVILITKTDSLALDKIEKGPKL